MGSSATWPLVPTPPAPPAGPGPALATSDADTAPLAYEADHAAAGVERLIDVFRKPRIEHLVRTLVGRLQGAEDLCWQLLEERGLEAINGRGPAAGVQLDGIGRIVGEPRGEKGDELYLVFLKAAVLVNRSHGRAAQLLRILELLPAVLFDFKEEGPAAVRIVLNSDAYPADLFRLLSRAVGSGIRFLYSFESRLEVNVFSCSGVHGASSSSPLKGCSSPYTTPRTGGHICGGFLR